MKLLEAAIVDEDDELQRLRAENADLRRELKQAHADMQRAERVADQSVGRLRQQLAPLYRALQAVFGEMDAIGATETAPATYAMWDEWKRKLDKGCGKAIDALLIHGEMSRRQLAVACGYSPQNISNIVSKLNGLSLLVKNGDRVSLRKIG